jgi:branched-chain amino acid transport system ATP-binding protein
VSLTVDNLVLRFGGVVALNGVSLAVERGELLALIGPNGAGKTSLLNSINGFYRPDQGTVTYRGRDLRRLASHAIARLGIGRTFQAPQLYGGLTVLENILAGRDPHFRAGMLAGALYFGRGRREEIRHRRVAENIIDFLELAPVREHPVGSLPYGLRKRVDLGRALALEPEVLLLDEPMAGMNREEKEDMARFVLDVHEERGLTVVFVEHDMGLVMDIADRVVVLEFGRKIAEGPPREITRDARVIQAYLGSRWAATDPATRGAERPPQPASAP